MLIPWQHFSIIIILLTCGYWRVYLYEEDFLVGGIVHAVSKAAGDIGEALHKAADAVGSAVDTTGKAVSSVGQDIQNGVDSAGNWVDNHVDSAVDSFEHSAVGNNVVGHALGSVVKDSAHFTTGVVSGATTLVSGTAELAGGAMQYASNSKFRTTANKEIGYVATHPGQAAGALWKSGVNAFEKDPAHAAGEMAGVIGSLVLTGGAAGGGDAAGEGAALTADAENTVSKVGDLADAAGSGTRDAASLAKGLSEKVGLFGKSDVSDSKILNELKDFGHGVSEHFPGSPKAADAFLQKTVENGAQAATRFTSEQAAVDTAKQTLNAFTERAAQDPEFAAKLQDFLDGKQPAIGTVFDTGKPIGEGFIRGADGTTQKVEDISKAYVRLKWSGGKPGAGIIKVFTLYPKA